MSESGQHASLSEMVVDWAKNHCGFNKGPIIYLHRKNPVTGMVEVPPKIGESIPDVFIKNTDKFDYIIGEAKTSKDLDATHTKKQLLDYLSFCHLTSSSLFIFAVPWPYVVRAINLVKIIVDKQKLSSAKWVILNDLKDVFWQ